MAREKLKLKEQQTKKNLTNTNNFKQSALSKTGSQIMLQSNKKKSTLLKQNWLNFLDEEHADAVISDSFWYVICKICNPQLIF